MKSNILVGVLAGFAAGAVLGVLMAPDKGAETRKKFAKKGSEYLDELKERCEGIFQRMNEKYEASGGKTSNGEAKS
jgi:gas vesicle protein